ncbi:hypothetical protein GE061_012186 [Apolygus lucorum]|uniref:Uncharacterized protein n=1 Tax=Apolygus lucorum TaxID=248454 RepID=A0A8S9XRU8_APOLU|nr:hypothetical protein GE061_012186 [Apolygus lucorum]
MANDRSSKSDSFKTVSDDDVPEDANTPQPAKLEKRKSDASVSSKKSEGSVKGANKKESPEKGKDKGKDKEEKRGSLKFGEDDEPPKGKEKKEKGKKNEEDDKSASKGFDTSKYKKPTIVVFHDHNDLAMGRGVGYKPDDAVPRAGPGVTAEIEQLYGPCHLLSEFKYTTWASTVVPLKNHNIVQGFNEMTMCLLKLAANGGENMSHEDAFLAISFSPTYAMT